MMSSQVYFILISLLISLQGELTSCQQFVYQRRLNQNNNNHNFYPHSSSNKNLGRQESGPFLPGILPPDPRSVPCPAKTLTLCGDPAAFYR